MNSAMKTHIGSDRVRILPNLLLREVIVFNSATRGQLLGNL